MNDIVETLLNHKYKDESMKKHVFILKRSKSKRIKDKAFSKLFYAYLEEKPVSIIGGKVVLITKGEYLKLENTIENNTAILEGLKDAGAVSDVKEFMERIHSVMGGTNEKTY